MYYTIYKTTCLSTGKTYIGFHKTDNLDDGYLGSGKLFQRALKKYGPENFRKEILFVFDNPEDMFAKEAELVSEDFVTDPNTYNLKKGGVGGWDHIDDGARSKAAKSYSGSRHHWNGIPLKTRSYYDKQCKGIKRAWSKGAYANRQCRGFLGKTHSPEAKAAIGAANSKHQSGEGNSQYGTCWIHSNEEKRSMRINRSDLQEWIDRGWTKGRKMIFGK